MEAKNQVLCQACVLPESSVVRIADNGKCNVCNSKDLKYVISHADREKLRSIIGEIRKKGASSEYDCIVGWSGGRDSTALLYELVKTHNLRCVAVFFRTPFTPDEILVNVHSIAKKLGVRLIEKQTPANHLKIASFCIKQYAKTRMPVLINLACASCKFLNREMFRLTRKMKIRSIIYGGNQYEYVPLGPAAIEVSSENRFSFTAMLKDNLLRLKKGTGFLISSPRLLRYFFTFFKASFLYVNPYTIYFRFRYPGISRYDYYLFAEWEEKRINFILNELEWKLPEGCNSTWKADCTFEAVKNSVFKESLGFTYAHAMYSNLVRAGQITREEALKRLEKENVSEKRLGDALRLCGVPEDICLKGGQ